MGNCFGEPSASNDATPPDERRRQMAAAAERRIQQADSRGLKDPEGFKRKQQAQQQAEQNLNPNQEAPLKWNVT